MEITTPTRGARGNILAHVRPNASALSRALTVVATAALFASSADAHQGNPNGARKEEELSRARASDKEGAKAYREGRYADAIRHFEEAHRLGGPAFELWNVAKCHLRLDQPEQAVEMLRRYLATPGIPKEDREEASRQLERIEAWPSALTVSSAPSGAEVTIDGVTVEGRTPLSVPISPGTHTVTVTSAGRSHTRQVDARYGRPVVVDAPLDGGLPENPYDTMPAPRVALRGVLGLVVPRHGSIGGRAGVGATALGTYRIKDVGKTSIAVGALLSVSGDAWGNRTGQANSSPSCGLLTDAQSATAASVFAIGSASSSIAPRLRVAGIGGVGAAGYFVDDVGGDLFVPSCRASPGVVPALLFGVGIDYAVTSYLRISALPLTWQVQPAFDGTRAAPRDASGVWMRFGIGVGAGVDL